MAVAVLLFKEFDLRASELGRVADCGKGLDIAKAVQTGVPLVLVITCTTRADASHLLPSHRYSMRYASFSYFVHRLG